MPPLASRGDGPSPRERRHPYRSIACTISSIRLPTLTARLAWLARLTPEGRAVLVVQKHLGSDSLARRLADEGWTVRRLASRQAYRILEVTR